MKLLFKIYCILSTCLVILFVVSCIEVAVHGVEKNYNYSHFNLVKIFCDKF